MNFKTQKNEVDGRPSVPSPFEEIQARIMWFVQEKAGFAQVFTISKDGFPVGRTMGALLNSDWTVDLVQRRVHRRIGQLSRNPRMEIVWCGPPTPDSTNDRPHVYDFGLLVPRVVFLRGRAEFMDANWLLERYNKQTAINRSFGRTKAPERTPENVVAELIGIRVRPTQIRAEGFGSGAESHTWKIDQ